MSDDTKIEFVTVKAAQEDSRVALYENHPDHITKDSPTGEAFISGDGTVHTVARTPTVEQKLRDGVLVEVSKSEARGAASAQDEETKRAAAQAKAEDEARAKAENEARARAEAQKPAVSTNVPIQTGKAK